MKVGQCCKHSVVSISGSEDIVEAARLMREAHVGFVVVFKEGDALQEWRTRRSFGEDNER